MLWAIGLIANPCGPDRPLQQGAEDRPGLAHDYPPRNSGACPMGSSTFPYAQKLATTCGHFEKKPSSIDAAPREELPQLARSSLWRAE